MRNRFASLSKSTLRDGFLREVPPKYILPYFSQNNSAVKINAISFKIKEVENFSQSYSTYMNPYFEW